MAAAFSTSAEMLIAATTAVLVVVFLRHVRPGSEEERPPDVEREIPRVPAAAEAE